MSGPVVESLQLHRQSRQLEVAFSDGHRFMLPCEYLRVNSPSAEVQGHHPSQRVLVSGKREVNITAIDTVGHYAVCLSFSDGHASGIYSWDTLYRLGREQPERWSAYLAELAQAGLSRDPPSR